jgi:regulator of nonsense transcripts 1
LRGSDIGVITPYAAQIRLLDHYLHQEPTRQTAFLDLLGDERARELEDIEIRTVDGFEGREKEVIIFSTVRSNERGYVGFLADWRRLNVGLTRAKRVSETWDRTDRLVALRGGHWRCDAGDANADTCGLVGPHHDWFGEHVGESKDWESGE